MSVAQEVLFCQIVAAISRSLGRRPSTSTSKCSTGRRDSSLTSKCLLVSSQLPNTTQKLQVGKMIPGNYLLILLRLVSAVDDEKVEEDIEDVTILTDDDEP